MLALVIYDLTGKIWSIHYGEDNVPQGLLSLYVDMPDGAQIDHIDLSDPSNPKPVFSYLPETDLSKLENRIGALEAGDRELTVTVADMIGGME